IIKTQKPKEARLVVTNADGREVPAPQTYINSLASSFSFDPLKFCYASEKEQVNWLLDALGIQFSPVEIARSIEGSGIAEKLPLPPVPIDLRSFDHFAKNIYEERRAVNVRITENGETLENIRKTLPGGYDKNEPQPDISAQLKAKIDERTRFDLEESEMVASAQKQASGERERLQDELHQRVKELQDLIEQARIKF